MEDALVKIKQGLWILLLLLIGLQIQCTIPDSADLTPPVVAILYPYPGAVIAGETYISVESGDNRTVQSVWYYLDGVLMGSSTRRNPTFALDVTEYADNQVHVLHAAAKDTDGNIGYAGPVNVVISDAPDLIVPVVQIVNPQSGQQVQDTVHVVASAFDERIIREVAFFIDGDSVLSDSLYPYEYYWPVTDLADSTNHTVLAKAFDGGDNWSWSAPVTVTVFPSLDRIPPTATLIYPNQGQVLFGVVEVKVDASDDKQLDRVEFYIDGEFKHVVSADTATAPFTYNWDTAPYADNQTHTLYFRVFDRAGNRTQTSPAGFIVSQNNSGDVTPPTGQITYPIAGSTVYGTVTVYVDAFDLVGVDHVDFYVDGVQQFHDASAPWEFVWDTTPYADRLSHAVFAKIYDAAGNVTNTAAANYVVNPISGDIIPPTVQIIYPLAGSVLTGTVTVHVNADDNVGVTRADFYVDGVYQASDMAEPWSYDWNTAPYADNGSHSVFVKVYDAAGNYGNSASVVYTVSGSAADEIAPTVTLLYPVSGSTVTDTVAVSVDARDNIGVTRVEFFVDGVLEATDTSAPWGFNWDTTLLTPGAGHTLYIRAYDAAENVGVAGPFSFIVN
jgi:chitinase